MVELDSRSLLRSVGRVLQRCGTRGQGAGKDGRADRVGGRRRRFGAATRTGIRKSRSMGASPIGAGYDMEGDGVSAGGARRAGQPAACNSAACRVFSSNVATVIGPTPPGTGVIQAAFSAQAA